MQGGTTSDTFTYEVSFVYPDAPDVNEVVIDGTGYAMTAVETSDGVTLYRYQTQLPAGAHNYYFHFGVDDPEVADATTPTVNGPHGGQHRLRHGQFRRGQSAAIRPTSPAANRRMAAHGGLDRQPGGRP